MAIFSQLNKQTLVDFRHYDSQNPNRRVPFKIPKKIKDKLKQLMNKLQLGTGSIDLLMTPQNKFIFLEVNPIGQFGMVSTPCNYQLECKVALELMKE